MRDWLPAESYKRYKRIRRSGILQASPPIVLAAGFILLIALGTALLSLPAAVREPITLTQAFFMATSAVTVTGLAVIEPAISLSRFGQTVLIALVQLGGLGFVTFAVVAAITLGKRLSLQHQALALEAFNQTSVSKIRRTAFSVLKIALLIEGLAMIILFAWWARDYPIDSALYLAVFHSIAAFNNAGFSLFPGSLAQFVSDPVTILVITACIVLGGIGFSVLADVSHKRRWSGLMPYTKVVLLGTVALNLFGFIAVWAIEFRNPSTLGELPLHGQALAAWLQSVTSRTAGFTSIDVASLRDSSTIIVMALMFIGGGSLSTASGIKVGTFVVLVAAVYSYIFQRKEVVLLKRSISPETVQKSLALVVVTTALIFIGTLLITLMEDAPFLSLLFEIVSAVSTTGMSHGITPGLSPPSQLMLTLLMFAGRLGPLTLAYSLATQKRSRIRYPATDFQVG